MTTKRISNKTAKASQNRPIILANDDPTPTATLRVGDGYRRDRYEVQTQGEDKRWRCSSRGHMTLAEAHASLADRKQFDAGLKWLVNFGKFPPARIVRVEAVVYIVEKNL